MLQFLQFHLCFIYVSNLYYLLFKNQNDFKIDTCITSFVESRITFSKLIAFLKRPISLLNRHMKY